jgi:site-specific recombinase XerC
MQQFSLVKPDHSLKPDVLLDQWRTFLHEQDHSPGTVKKYTQAVSLFLVWYEQEERVPLQLTHLTPIALIGYRNELQHEQHKSISTINVRISALRAWCAWLVDQNYLPLDPAARVKLVWGEVGSNVKVSPVPR